MSVEFQCQMSQSDADEWEEKAGNRQQHGLVRMGLLCQQRYDLDADRGADDPDADRG